MIKWHIPGVRLNKFTIKLKLPIPESEVEKLIVISKSGTMFIGEKDKEGL